MVPGSRIALGLAAALSTLSLTHAALAQQATMERIKRLGTILVCADPDRLPYSSEKLNPAGFDLDVSQEIAKELGVKLGYTWHSTHRGKKIVRQMVDGTCDFFPGFPLESSFEEDNFRVVLSKPYYSSGFATLTRSDAPETILQDSKAKGVGVQMGTLPDFRLFERGYERKLFRNTKDMIDAVKHKEIDAAVVTASEGGWEVKSGGDASLKVLANTEKDFVFPMAIATRKDDKELREAINTAIDKMKADGRLEAIFTKYGMVQLAGTGGGEPPKSKAQKEEEEGKKDDDGPKPDKKSELAPADTKAASLSNWLISPAAAEEGEKKPDFKPGEDPGADWHGLAINPEFAVDPKKVEDFPADDKSIDKGRQLYKQACYKCHGNNGISGGTIPDLRNFAAKADHYEMFMVIQAGRLDRGMPAWNDYLTEDEIKKIVVYVKALHRK